MGIHALMFRFCDSPFGVFSFLQLREDRTAIATFCTAEDDWLNNKPQISCIPAGTYVCKRVKSPRFGDTFEITGVPGRDAILFHAGNTEEDVRGCVMLGEKFGALTVADEDAPGHPKTEKWGIKGGTSKPALKRFLDLLDKVDSFTLEIRWSRPGEWRTEV